MSEEITPYLAIRDKLCSFTIINCINRKFPWNLIGHTAILYKDSFTGQLMVLESTTLNKFSGKSGVQLAPFGTWLARYPGKVFARIPTFVDSSQGSNAARDIMLAEFIKEYLGSSYPDLSSWSGRMKLILSKLDFTLFGVDYLSYKGHDEGIFCTMLVIMLLKRCECFRDWTWSREFEPDDTRGNSEPFERSLVNMAYETEIRLK